jgi:hypothetical protein
MYGVAMTFAYCIATAKPTPLDTPLVHPMAELVTFSGGLYGIYCITMRIPVDSESLRVSSVFGARVTTFEDIRSLTDREGTRWRTLDVIDARAKRILYVTSSFLPDYSDLVYYLQHCVKKNLASDVLR